MQTRSKIFEMLNASAEKENQMCRSNQTHDLPFKCKPLDEFGFPNRKPTLSLFRESCQFPHMYSNEKKRENFTAPTKEMPFLIRLLQNSADTANAN